MSGAGDHDELRRLLGGYLLGGLDEADTDRLDEHLRDCDDCRTELDQLAGVPELLRRLPEAQRADDGGEPAVIGLNSRPSPDRIEGMLRRLRAEKARTRRRGQARWLAAAAVVLVAAAVGISVLRADRSGPPPTTLPSPELVTAQFTSAEGSGLAGEAVVTPKTWGVSIALDVSRLDGAGPFTCQVRNRRGQTEQAAAWGVTPSGKAKVIGASSTQVTDLDSIEIADHTGNLLGTARVN